MNKISYFLLIFAMLVGLPSCFNAHSESKNENDILTNITTAFNQADYREITHQTDELIELTFENDVRRYSKAQVQFVLKDFFKKYPAEKFEIVHHSDNKALMKYIIGEYKSESGAYRIAIRMHENKGKYQINMMKFRRNV